MQQEDFNILSDKIQNEFEFNASSNDFIAFFKPFVIKVLSSIIFSSKISDNTKRKVFGIIAKSGKILSYFLESLNEKELLILLNDIALSELLIENSTEEIKRILYNKLNKEIGIFPKVSLIDQVPNKIKQFLQDINSEQNQEKESNTYTVRNQFASNSFQETEQSKPAQLSTTQSVKTKQNNIQSILIDIVLSDEVAGLISQTNIQKDQFLIIANKENINLAQLQKMQSLLDTEHDKRALLTNALLNPFVKNNMEIVKYIIQQAHYSSNFELCSNAMDILDTIKEN